ncbi:MAG: OadG family protein [Clostridia bacterium]|nr:OadG family protein [Clostridia bacterium]
MKLSLLMNAALTVRENGTYEPFSSEAWRYAGEMTLLGMAMVFAVLAILWGILAIFKLVFAGKTPKEPKPPKTPKVKESKKQSESAPAVDDTVAAVIAASIQAIREDEAQSNAALVAILTAAVSAYRAEEGTEGGFRVVSFKRAGGAWNAKR